MTLTVDIDFRDGVTPSSTFHHGHNPNLEYQKAIARGATRSEANMVASAASAAAREEERAERRLLDREKNERERAETRRNADRRYDQKKRQEYEEEMRSEARSAARARQREEERENDRVREVYAQENLKRRIESRSDRVVAKFEEISLDHAGDLQKIRMAVRDYCEKEILPPLPGFPLMIDLFETPEYFLKALSREINKTEEKRKRSLIETLNTFEEVGRERLALKMAKKESEEKAFQKSWEIQQENIRQEEENARAAQAEATAVQSTKNLSLAAGFWFTMTWLSAFPGIFTVLFVLIFYATGSSIGTGKWSYIGFVVLLSVVCAEECFKKYRASVDALKGQSPLPEGRGFQHPG